MGFTEQATFAAAFEAAFYWPTNGYEWRTEEGRAKWIDLEVWKDRLAGPLYSVKESGGCGYVYARTDEYFSGVTNPEELLTLLLRWQADLSAELETFTVKSAEQEEDAAAMRGFVSGIRSLVESAYLIEKRRLAVEGQ